MDLQYVRANTSRITRPIAVALVLAGYVAGTTVLAWTRMPQPDEGHFANAGYELATHGRLAMPMWTEWIPSLDQRVYAQMPLYYVQLAPWVAAFGSSLRAVRMNSVLWGVALVVAWFAILRVVGRDWRTAFLGLVLMAFNYDVMNMTSARYDPMCAALSAAGVACYLRWRERHLAGAVLTANACLAAALLTHPFGLVGVAGFVLCFLALDARRFSIRVAGAAMAPYAVACAAWGAYVLEDPVAFRSQLSENASGRLGDLSHPWAILSAEITERYLKGFAGWRPDVPLLMRVKVFFLVAYAAAAVAVVLTPALRRRREVAALVLWAVAAFAIVAAADSNRWYIYLLHVVPIDTAIVAVYGGYLMKRALVPRYAVAGAAACWVLFAIGTVGLRARLDDYDRLYLPTAEYIEHRLQPGDLVMAGGEFGPPLGFSKHVLEDPKFGFRNGRVPDWIVYDKLHEVRMAQWAKTNRPLYGHVQSMLERYELVLDNRQPYNYYRVYHRPALH